MAASQRVNSRVPAPQRSLLPTVRGVPAYAAVLIAAAFIFVGFLIDALGDVTDLTGTFSTFYIIGCLAAVAAVRFRSLFTTMVLPPLLLFIAVPIAYRQLTGSSTSSLKDILLNLAIPLVHRFPPMMLATVLVLLVAAIRIAQYRSEKTARETVEARRGTSWGRRERRTSRAEPRSRAEDRPRRDTAKRPGRGQSKRSVGGEGKAARGAKPTRAETLAARSKASANTKAKSRPKRPENPEPDYTRESAPEPPRRGGRGRPAAEQPARAATPRSREAQPRGREVHQPRPPRTGAPMPEEPARARPRRGGGEPPRQPQVTRFRDREPIPERRRPERM
ncbi:DUF6542 domain-containing protein [Nocardia speluncae]|uniref:DUF6542 domain-containing protein n=1 Tax=Nocardia speluncae TaxID=419477 RepID=UPI001B3479C5|nr:DUF6542 domain-containing protein [Nocardia speluncae]